MTPVQKRAKFTRGLFAVRRLLPPWARPDSTSDFDRERAVSLVIAADPDLDEVQDYLAMALTEIERLEIEAAGNDRGQGAT